MKKDLIIQNIKAKWNVIFPHLNEKAIRLWAASEALSIKSSGITNVSKATGISRATIYRGIDDIKKGTDPNRVRKGGGGRKSIINNDPTLYRDLEEILEISALGDPESFAQWTSDSIGNITTQLKNKGHKISNRTVNRLLHKLDYSLQANKKTSEGSDHPDRNAQFNYISNKVKKFQKNKYPIISVDAKKKELIGNFKNNGKEWRKKKDPRKVNSHDFPDKTKGKAAPYGVYDVIENKGWVSVSISHDTAEFAVETIKKWWNKMGKPLYSDAKEILITADCGGSNGYRIRLWKWELQKLANELNLIINICHFPPGTSKWNKIEHKMFSFISINWKGKPLKNLQFIIKLIGQTKTKKGLEIKTEIDEKEYQIGKVISKKQMNLVNLEPCDFHGEWNYKIKPNKH